MDSNQFVGAIIEILENDLMFAKEFEGVNRNKVIANIKSDAELFPWMGCQYTPKGVRIALSLMIRLEGWVYVEKESGIKQWANGIRQWVTNAQYESLSGYGLINQVLIDPSSLSTIN